MIVNHASTAFDSSKKAKPSIDRAIKHFRDKGSPVVFFIDHPGDYHWYTSERQPDYAYFSAGGENDVSFADGVNEISIVGGYFEHGNMTAGCLNNAWIEFIYNYFELSPARGPLTINFFIPAMYYYRGHGFQQSSSTEDFLNLPETTHMSDLSEPDMLPFNSYGPILDKYDYTFALFADSIAERTWNAGKSKKVHLKFWSDIPDGFLD